MHGLKFSQDYFNGLPDVEIASARIAVSGELPLALAALGGVLVSHGMANKWAIGLLHKHWTLSEGEIPLALERGPKCGETRVIEFKPVRLDKSSQYHPSVLGLSDGSDAMMPLEFSALDEAQSAIEGIEADCRFLDDVAECLRHNRLSAVFGLTGIRRYHNDTHDLVEFNYIDRISVVREVPRAEARGMKLIETSWQVAPDVVAGTCKSKCMNYCSSPSTGGNHTHGHSTYHDPNG